MQVIRKETQENDNDVTAKRRSKNTISVNWQELFQQESKFHVPTKYDEEPQNMIISIGPYVFRYHRTSILQLFSPIKKGKLWNSTWDPETGEPVLHTESMEDNILDRPLKIVYCETFLKKRRKRISWPPPIK